MFSISSDLMRIDSLTGCKNILGFFEACMEPSVESSPDDPLSGLKISPDFLINSIQYSAFLIVVMKDMEFLSETKGPAHVNSAIRWMGILLQEETNQPVYRIGVIEFAVFLKMDTEQEHVLLLERIHERMNLEAKLLDFPGAPATSVLILNDQPSTRLDNLLIQVIEALARVQNSSLHHMTFQLSDLLSLEWDSNMQKPDSHLDISFAVRRIAQEYIFNMVEMGHNLDMAQQVAYTDTVSNLPNMRAALINLEEVLQNARTKGQPFSILLIDGDNLRAANLISYAAGDEIIRAMGTVFQQNLRPGDYVARWRTGDEFIVTLPDTSNQRAIIVGERFRLAVKNASRLWTVHVTISIGIASYPANGEDINSLIEKAESANKCAKQRGKDQVVPAN